MRFRQSEVVLLSNIQNLGEKKEEWSEEWLLNTEPDVFYRMCKQPSDCAFGKMFNSQGLRFKPMHFHKSKIQQTYPKVICSLVPSWHSSRLIRHWQPSGGTPLVQGQLCLNEDQHFQLEDQQLAWQVLRSRSRVDGFSW